MAPCSGTDASCFGGYQKHETAQASLFAPIFDHIHADAVARPTPVAIACTFARTSFRVACATAALSLSVLAGCAEPNELCAARGGVLVPNTSSESWDSAGQRRAAVAIECDAQEILSRISTVAIPGTDVTALHNRERELAKVALDAVRAGPVESSRLPLSLAHQQMYEVAAEAERASGSPAFLAWTTNPWKPLRPLERAPGTETGTLWTALMPGERRAIALNVRSTSLTNKTFRIWANVPGLRPDAIQIYQVNWTGDDRSNWTAAELELLGDASSTREATVLPGVTRQIWLEVHPDAAAVPGQFIGNVSLSTDEGQTTDVAIAIKVFATRFNRPSMRFGGWDYSSGFPMYSLRETNRSQLIEYLQAREVNTPWVLRAQIMHWGSADGSTKPGFYTSSMEQWISRWPTARRFRVYLEVSDHIGGLSIADAGFASAVATWAQAWATEIRRLNKSPEQFDLLLVDEPQTDEQFRITEAWAGAIRGSGTGFRIWTDLISQDPLAISDSVLNVVDTVAVNIEFAELQEPWRHELWARMFSERGKDLEVYGFGAPARRLDPYTYYRLISWRAFFMGASAVSLWSFVDTGDSSPDNEFATNDLNYSPLFISDESVRPGKQMEAAAEGIQDTYYLEMLKQVATAHAHEAVRHRAQELLHEVAGFVYRSPKSANAEWLSQSEADGADNFRIQIAEFLDSLPR